MNNSTQASINNPVFANQYFDGTYDPTQGSVYRTGDVLSNLLDDYTGEEVQFVKVPNQSGVVVDGIVYRQKDGELFADCSTLSSGCISVKRFGAKGDGTTDDNLAIQKAFDNLGKTFSTLLLPAGIYRFTSNLVLQGASNINLHFENATLFDAGKVIPLVGGTTGKTPVGIRFSQCSNLTINGLRRNGDVGRSLAVVVTSESDRVPSFKVGTDFTNSQIKEYLNEELKEIFKNKSIEWNKSIISECIFDTKTTQSGKTKSENIYTLIKNIPADMVKKARKKVGDAWLKA